MSYLAVNPQKISFAIVHCNLVQPPLLECLQNPQIQLSLLSLIVSCSQSFFLVLSFNCSITDYARPFACI